MGGQMTEVHDTSPIGAYANPTDERVESNPASVIGGRWPGGIGFTIAASKGADTAGRNAAIVRRAVEDIWNRGNLAMADSLFAATYVNHGGLISDLVRGPEAIKVSVALFRTAFPDLNITIERLTARGDTVELRWAAEGTSQRGPIAAQQDRPQARLIGTTLSTLASGKVMESWTDWDHESVLQSLETIPLDCRATKRYPDVLDARRNEENS